MKATRSLPVSYSLRRVLDLSQPAHALWMNLAAFPLVFLFGWLFSRLLHLFPVSNPAIGIWDFLVPAPARRLVTLTLSVIIMLVMHELIHGVFFWLLTGDRPRFAIKPGYAYAAAPDWYLPAAQYLLVGLSPFLVISIACIIFSLALSSLEPYFLIIAALNAAGSLGDLIVVGWVLTQPASILVRDEGDRFSTYISGTGGLP